jgi:hypothetical protein
MKKWRRPVRVGDKLEKLLAPIVKVIDETLDTNIKDCSACKKRKEWLNDLTKEDI